MEEAKLLASDGATDDLFGMSVSISSHPENKFAIVGAHGDNDNGADSGSAYIYRFNPDTSRWIEEVKLIPSDGAEFDEFGSSVSISGPPGKRIAIVGAWLDDDHDSASGSAYIFCKRGRNWVQEAKLLAFDGAAFDFFGRAVSISSAPGKEVAIVGAHGDDDKFVDSGSAYIYRKQGRNWVQEAKLLAADGDVRDNFGISVSINGNSKINVAIVGAFFDNDNGFRSGSAYIYRKNGTNWIQEAKLLASDGEARDWFGISVSISGAPGNEIAIVGASFGNDNGMDPDSAYIYRYDSHISEWVEELILHGSDGGLKDLFGAAVSISATPGNEIAIVGARLDDENGFFSGSAYIFELNCGPPACRADWNGSGNVNVADLLMLLGAWGPCPLPCPSDTNSDGAVNVSELLELLAAWGPCP